jgi:hypothetical protein
MRRHAAVLALVAAFLACGPPCATANVLDQGTIGYSSSNQSLVLLSSTEYLLSDKWSMYQKTDVEGGIEFLSMLIKRDAGNMFAWSVYKFNVQDTGWANVTDIPHATRLAQRTAMRDSYYTNTPGGLLVQNSVQVFPPNIQGGIVRLSLPFYEGVEISGLDKVLFNGEGGSIPGISNAAFLNRAVNSAHMLVSTRRFQPFTRKESLCQLCV